MKKYVAILTMVCLAARVAFGDVWQELAKYKYGEGNAADEADQLLQKTPVDQHGVIEDSLIVVVSAKDATEDGKVFACRMLQQIGTEKCIPAVAGLLGDEVLSHYACLVLQQMANPKADEALRTALESVANKAKIGIVGSLGARKDLKAVAQIATLVGNADPAVASAAISALGKIGGKSAASYLRKLKPAESLQTVYMVALLDCARSLKGSDAVSLYELVLAGKGTQRIGALSGLLVVDEKKAIALMVGFLKGNDAIMSGGVLTLVADEKSERLTKAMLELLGKLPEEKRASLITVLGARGDRAALVSVTGYLTSTNESVRNAALIAVGKMGDESAVKMLLGMNGGSKDIIVKMTGDGVDAALMKALEDNKLKVPAIRAMIARNYFPVLPSLFRLLNESDIKMRKLAWEGLGALASDCDDVVQMAETAFAIKNETELSYAVAATKNACSHATDKAKCFDVIVSYYDAASDATKLSIIELAALVGSPSAMEFTKKVLKSGKKEIHAKAIRSLAAWCNVSAAGDLLDLAKSAPEEVDRILALRGYIRLAGADYIGLDALQKAEMFSKADQLVKRADEKKMIASSLSRIWNATSLNLVNKYLNDPEVKKEAEGAAVKIIEHLRKDGPMDLVKDVANKLLTSKNPAIVRRAKTVLENLGK